MTTATTSLSTARTARSRRSGWRSQAKRISLLAFALWSLSLGVTHAGFLGLEWAAPTTNVDGSRLLDLANYRVYVGTSAPACHSENFHELAAPVGNPTPGDTFSATLTGLTQGTTYWVRVSAVNFSGSESTCSAAVSGVAHTDLEATPGSLHFGEVTLGSPATLDLTVHNVGATILTGTMATSAPFSIISGASFNMVPGASRVVRVRFMPLTAQTFVSNLNIKTSGDDVSLAVSGIGVALTPAILQFSQTNYMVTEGGTTTITVTRTGGTHGGVTVQYATSDGTATVGTDYTATAGTLTFAANQMSRTFSLTTLQDAAAEGPETLILTLSNPGGSATLGAPSATTVTINDDEPSLRFSAAAYTVAETAGIATISVTRVGSAVISLTVDYTTTAAGTATPGPGGDYTPVSGTLTFAPGQTSRSFTVPIVDDDVVDGPKTVGLQLTNPTGATLGTPSTATLTITDNDVAGTIQFGAAQYAADEGGGMVNVTVMRTGGAAKGASATYRVTGATATSGSDFTIGGNGTVTFARGATMVTIPIALTSDGLLEGRETLELTLLNPTGGATLGSIRRAVVMIDEMAFQFAPAVYPATEGGVATITVMRTGPTNRAATVNWATSDGTATAGLDYTPGAGTLTFPVGVRTRTFTVATINDTVMEGPETVLLTLRDPSAGSIRGAQRTAVLTISDNDGGGIIRFGAATYLVPEKAGTFTVPVVRTGGVASSVTVDYAVGEGTATGGVDYTLLDGTLTFAAGQTTALIRLALADDTLVEADEMFVLQLRNPTGGATLGTPNMSTIVITDNDRSATLQFSAATYTAVEGAGNAIVTITRAGSTATPVSVMLTTSDGTARAGTDYTAVNVPVDFGVGATSRTIAVPIIPNSTVDGARTVTLTLSRATAPAAVGARATAVLTIVDDDSTLEFSAAGYSVTEGGTATITVRRIGSALGSVSVGYSVIGGSGNTGSDYVATSGRLTFGPAS